MKAVEEYKPELEGVLPKDEYFRLTRDEKTKNIPNQLLKSFANIPADFSGDLFGQIYEYFLAEFARSEGSKGGEFFTPRSVVRLMVEMIEPHGGKVFDPACGSGGMFVQSAQFIEEHRKELKDGDSSVFVYPLPYLYYWIKLAKPHFELLAVGATFAELTKGTFKRIEILTPPAPIVSEFTRIEAPLLKAIENLLRANQKLKETRDKLLPRLISGKLSVENLAIQFPLGMAEEMPRAGLE